MNKEYYSIYNRFLKYAILLGYRKRMSKFDGIYYAGEYLVN